VNPLRGPRALGGRGAAVPNGVCSPWVRLARDPQMSLAYLCSQQMEKRAHAEDPAYGLRGAVRDRYSVGHGHKDTARLPAGGPDARLRQRPDTPAPRREASPQLRVPPQMGAGLLQAAPSSLAMGISPLPTAMQRDNQSSPARLSRRSRRSRPSAASTSWTTSSAPCAFRGPRHRLVDPGAPHT
jgi:hypothetical protein